MSNDVFVNNIFNNLTGYLDEIKKALYDISAYNNGDEVVDVLNEHKLVLQSINRKMQQYTSDVKSTINHIDELLSNNIGRGRKSRKNRKNRKSRKSRKKL